MAIVLFTDFGSQDPYVGQVKAVLARDAPGVPQVDLLNDVPVYNVRAAAHLLASLVSECPQGSVFLSVVAAGVDETRAPVAAWIAAGTLPRGWLRPVKGLSVDFGAEDLAEIVYVDHYGNAMTGLRAERAPRGGK